MFLAFPGSWPGGPFFIAQEIWISLLILLDRRDTNVLEGTMRINIITWNVLADCYAHGKPKPLLQIEGEDLTPESQLQENPTKIPPHIAWSNRSLLILQCLLESNADILCLQEVDHYDDFYSSCLKDYSVVYVQRPGRNDGCLIAFKFAKFSFISKDEVSFDESVPLIDSLFDEHKYYKQNVGLIVKLQCMETNKQFVVSTCHVHWNPNLPEVKMSQVLYMLQRIGQFCSKEERSSIPVVLTGDFNTLPDDDLYSMIIHKHNTRVLNETLQSHLYKGSLYGPKTRFICDAGLNKLCKWLRVLGVNCALDAWDVGVPASSTKYKNASKWQWGSVKEAQNLLEAAEKRGGVSESVTGSAVSVPSNGSSNSPGTSQAYSARVASINAFFARAVREKRVILTTSKTLLDRASCPRSFYVNPSNMEAALVEITKKFGLALSRERFLTVCGKCGDEVEEVALDDPRLQDKYLPTDRTVFACVNCAQVRKLI
jgi:uncharacterized protein with PIN domain/exonuclease III